MAGAEKETRVKTSLDLSAPLKDKAADLAMLVLSSPMSNIRPAQVARRPVKVGDHLKFKTWRRSETPLTDTLAPSNRATVVVKCIGDRCPSEPNVAVHEFMGDGGPCPGDSGGAAVNDRGELVGVLLRGRVGSNGACHDPIFYDVTSTDGGVALAPVQQAFLRAER